MSFVSTGLNYTKEEIEINGNQIPLGKLHDEVCEYMEKVWKVDETGILDVSTALWLALEVLNKELSKQADIIKLLKQSNEFYSSLDSWNVYRNKGTIQEIRLSPTSDCSVYTDTGYTLRLGGKLARSIKKQVAELGNEK